MTAFVVILILAVVTFAVCALIGSFMVTHNDDSPWSK